MTTIPASTAKLIQTHATQTTLIADNFSSKFIFVNESIRRLTTAYITRSIVFV